MPSRTTDTIKVMDLFAGCGGFTEGFHQFRVNGAKTSPYRTVGAVEFNLAAASTYAANFGSEAKAFAGDIKDWTPDPVTSQVDVILGGPPCQGFSGLGKEDPDDPRNSLWREYVKIVRALQPKVFVMENVDRFLRSVEYTLLQKATEKGGELSDYRVETRILNAADYGVPQFRRRVIVLAVHRDLVAKHPNRLWLTHPEPTHRRPSKVKETDELALFETDHPTWLTARAVFDRTPAITESTTLPKREIDLLGKLVPGTFRTSELHIGRIPTELSIARYAAIPPGGNRHSLADKPGLSTENWLRHRTGAGDVMGRVRWDEPSVTIRTEFYKPEKGRYLHPEANRPITHMEAALLQGFPDDFLWCGSKVEIARQIGNAVPVGLARAIAGALYNYLAECGEVQRCGLDA
ncbi:DNA (cytosine-5)-methyltransferase 1 [Nonomuraea muscovyensis]|uniref:Cytosine-specific methyltransferase n=1 Tax=Nonomuraea muscovyensis TaxID=1124761 RepID=A0A7X0C0L1_9ACTN|nr:DNA cytosine methyltransferase [Nonomuraea muscovyensis]MBB6345255.1 DNA (cytosine-5)-methyltransferase 1 [Nonomuraea muscovyensis]